MIGYLIGGGCCVATLATAGYHSLAPRSQLYGRTFIGSGHGRQLALTYDDGPNDPHTLKLLEVLARHEVRATFFVLGKFVAQRPEILREVARAGHVIGNHTYRHPNLILATRAQMEAEIRDCEKAIEDALGEIPSSLFRPPFGARRPEVLRAARALGYAPVMWSVWGVDWKPRTPEQVEAKVRRHVRGGDVILLHDGGHLRLGANRAHTVIATDRLIAHYKSAGYEFVTVPEMIGQQESTNG